MKPLGNNKSFPNGFIFFVLFDVLLIARSSRLSRLAAAFSPPSPLSLHHHRANVGCCGRVPLHLLLFPTSSPGQLWECAAAFPAHINRLANCGIIRPLPNRKPRQNMEAIRGHPPAPAQVTQIVGRL
ncbi:MAG: hypothetical protein V9G20_07780 [Candidatus Promineifilaceae bacterium]